MSPPAPFNVISSLPLAVAGQPNFPAWLQIMPKGGNFTPQLNSDVSSIFLFRAGRSFFCVSITWQLGVSLQSVQLWRAWNNFWVWWFISEYIWNLKQWLSSWFSETCTFIVTLSWWPSMHVIRFLRPLLCFKTLHGNYGIVWATCGQHKAPKKEEKPLYIPLVLKSSWFLNLTVSPEEDSSTFKGLLFQLAANKECWNSNKSFILLRTELMFSASTTLISNLCANGQLKVLLCVWIYTL